MGKDKDVKKKVNIKLPKAATPPVEEVKPAPVKPAKAAPAPVPVDYPEVTVTLTEPTPEIVEPVILEEIPLAGLPPRSGDESTAEAGEEDLGTALFPSRQSHLIVVPDAGPAYVISSPDLEVLITQMEELQDTPCQVFCIYDGLRLPTTKGPRRQILLPNGVWREFMAIVPDDYDMVANDGSFHDTALTTPTSDLLYEVAPAPDQQHVSLGELLKGSGPPPVSGVFDSTKLLAKPADS